MAPTTVQQTNVTVLVVEDDPLQRRILEDILGDEGFAVASCTCAADAVRLASTQDFAIAIIDQQLPDRLGIELAQQLDAIRNPPRIIIYTAFASFESARDAVNLGVFAYVEKLSDPEELLQHVHRAAADHLAQIVRETTELNRRIIEGVHGGIVEISFDGSINFANREAQRVLGLPHDELTSQYLNDFRSKTIAEDGSPFPVEDYPASLCLRTRRQSPPAIIGVMKPDGETSWAIFTAFPTPTGAIVTFLDITERKRAEAALQKAHDELEHRVERRTAELLEANQRLRDEIAERKRAEDKAQRHEAELAHLSRLSTLGELASGLSHELNQPLTAIANYARGALRRLTNADDQPEGVIQAIEHVVRQTERAGAIIRRMRQMVHKRDPKKAPVAVNALVIDMIELISPEARRHGVELTSRLAHDLPAFRVDGIQIEQVVLNLVRNAIDAACDASDHRRQVIIETRLVDEQMIEIAVSDMGRGITPENMAHIFDPFFTTRPEGMGMGLTISRSIVTSHGGKLLAENCAGGGACFRVLLPVQTEPPV